MNMRGFKLEKRDFRLIEHVYFFPVVVFVGRKLSDFIQWLWKSIPKTSEELIELIYFT